jgi:threonine dehydrogenase-like Zn-dependent dehydrogenase
LRGYVLTAPGKPELREVPKPSPGRGEALVRMTMASVCATDLKIVDGRFPVEPGRVLGHEFVGEVEELGEGVEGFEAGQRVLVHADTPCGMCFDCLGNANGRGCHTGGSLAAFHFGVLRDGVHAEHVVVPWAQGNMAVIPDNVSDEAAVMLCDMATTGFGGVETSGLRLGDTVAILGQGPVGLSATVAARLRGASLVITADALPARLEMSRRMGADHALDASEVDVVAEVERITEGRMVDVAMEAVGLPDTFRTALSLARRGGSLSSIGNYGMQGTLELALGPESFVGGVGEKTIYTTTAPGGKDRGRRLLELVSTGRFDLSPLVTHRFPLEDIAQAYDFFREEKTKVLKVAIHP